MWDDIVLNGLLIGKTITYRFIAGNVNVAEKMPWNLFNVLFQCVCDFFFPLNSFEDVESETFIVPLSVERVELRIPTTFVVLPGASDSAPSSPPEAHSGPDGLPGKKPPWGLTPLHWAARYGHVAAAELLLSKGAAMDAKTNNGRGPQSREGARHRVWPTWGSSEGFSGIETSAFSWNVWQSCKFSTPKTCETCREQWSQCNMPIMCGKRINVVEKMPWNLFDVFVNVFCFKSKIFIVRLSVERVELSIPTTFVVLGCWLLASSLSRPWKPPEVTRRCTLPRPKAASRLQSFCFQTGPRWMPRTTKARGLKAGSRARNPVSGLGHLRRVFFRDWNSTKKYKKCLHFQQMFGKVVSFQCNNVWKTDDLTCSRKMAHF